MANTYYVSASGSSGNSGLSSLLPKNSYANALASSGAGDSFLGHGGDTFRETVLPRAASQSFGAYGTGKPIISGANVVSGWAAASAPRYSASVSSTVRIVMVNGTRATQGSSATSLSNGEWFWQSGTLYYRSDAGNPTSLGLAIEVGQRDYCIDQNSMSGISISGVTCQRSQHTSNAAVYFHGTGQTSGFTVTGCLIQDNYSSGIIVHASSTLGTITSNSVLRNGQHGIWYDFSVGETNQTINDNTLTDNGWRSTGDFFVSGIIGAFRSGEMARNTIDNQGVGGSGGHAHGIYCNSSAAAGGTMLIHDNISKNAPNGFGLKTTQDAVIYNNVFSNNTGGGANLGQNDGSNNATILFHHNVVSVCSSLGGAGVDIKNAGSSGTLTVRGYHNTTYDNSGSSSGGEVNVESNLALFDWRNNIHYATNNASAKYIQMVAQSGTVTIDYNDYFNSPNSTPFRYNGSGMSLSTWKAQGFSPDAHSITGDPKFTNAGSGVFTLQSGSPAINAGVHVSGIDDGYAGGAPDLGAFETGFSSSVSGTAADAPGGVRSAASGSASGAVTSTAADAPGGLKVAATGSASTSVTSTAADALGGLKVAGTAIYAATGTADGTAADALGGVALSATGSVSTSGASGTTAGGVASAATGGISLSVASTAANALSGVQSAGGVSAAGGAGVVGGDPSAVAFLFAPNWETAIEMTSTWKTDVLAGENGTEQRVSMRDGPAESMKYAARIQSQEDAGALALLLAEQPTGRFNMPRWPDASALTTDVSIGGTSISCDTTDRLFTILGLALIWQQATGISEVRRIAGITSGALDLTGDPATKAWTGNSDVLVIPIAPAWLTLPLARTFVGGVLAEVAVACEWEVVALPAIGPTTSVAVTVAIGSDGNGTTGGAIEYNNIFLRGSYLVVHANVLDADDVVIPEAPVTWSLGGTNPTCFSVQPVGLFGENAILRNISPIIVFGATATLTATSGGASVTRSVVG